MIEWIESDLKEEEEEHKAARKEKEDHNNYILSNMANTTPE